MKARCRNIFKMLIHFEYFIYIYIYIFVCVHGYIKAWVGCKMQSSFQQKMCLVFHTQNCLCLSTFQTGYLFFIVIAAFCGSYHKIDAAILRRSVPQI